MRRRREEQTQPHTSIMRHRCWNTPEVGQPSILNIKMVCGWYTQTNRWIKINFIVVLCVCMQLLPLSLAEGARCLATPHRLSLGSTSAPLAKIAQVLFVSNLAASLILCLRMARITWLLRCGRDSFSNTMHAPHHVGFVMLLLVHALANYILALTLQRCRSGSLIWNCSLAVQWRNDLEKDERIFNEARDLLFFATLNSAKSSSKREGRFSLAACSRLINEPASCKWVSS